jgi:hypothetical protein
MKMMVVIESKPSWPNLPGRTEEDREKSQLR